MMEVEAGEFDRTAVDRHPRWQPDHRTFDRGPGTLVVRGTLERFRLASTIAAAGMLSLLLLSGCGRSTAGPGPQWEQPGPAAVGEARTRASGPADHHTHLVSPAAVAALRQVEEAVGQSVSGQSAVTTEALVRSMDEAGIARATVISMAYIYGTADVHFPDAETLVRAENDHVAAEVARFPDRLVGFCSMNPLGAYAPAEVQRCAGLAGIRGVKLHFGNADVDLMNPEQVERLQSLFSLADERGLALLVHLRNRNPAYGRAEAEVFIRDLLPWTSNVPVQIAHMGGAGGYDGPTHAAMEAFATAVESDGAEYRDRLWFDLSTAVLPRDLFGADDPRVPQVEAANRALAEVIRRVGSERVVFGSDWIGPDAEHPLLHMARYLEIVRANLPLDEEELATILGNEARYFR
jgi:uncharacterized protein